MDKEKSTDEVDFVQTSHQKNEICVTCKRINPFTKNLLLRNDLSSSNNNNLPKSLSTPKKTSVYGDCEMHTTAKTSLSPLERVNFLNFSSKCKENKTRLIKSSSIAKLFGNNYCTKKSEEQQKTALKKSNSVSEKFSNKSSEDDFYLEKNDQAFLKTPNSSSLDLTIVDKSNANAFKTLTRGIGRMLRRNCESISISRPDPEYKVLYLGNVLTGFAKGEFEFSNIWILNPTVVWELILNSFNINTNLSKSFTLL